MAHIAIYMPEHNAPASKEWMMICLPGRWGLIDLHQLEFTRRPATNAEFFARLRLEYDNKRYQPFPGWHFWCPRGRKLTGIHFVKFRQAGVMSPRDVRLQDNSPCVPDVGQEGWVRKAFREDPMEPPLIPNTMMWMLRGDDLEGLNIYDLVPRKLEDALPAELGLEGWGLYFAEEEYWKAWYPMVVLGGTLVIALGARVVFALTAGKALGLTVNSDTLIFLEFNMVVAGMAFFYGHLRDNQRVCWDLTEFC